MSKLFYLSAIIMLTITSSTLSQVKIIFDTDLGSDADDLGALAMLHNFVDNHECELLAVMNYSTERYAIPAIDAINRFYGHPDIPIGTRKGEIYFESWNYGKVIADIFPNELDHQKAIDATFLYRQLLAQSEDNSITIVAVAPLLNIQNLIISDADTNSPLRGDELIDKKVKEFVIMGGHFPKGDNEWNFNGQKSGLTQFVLKKLNTPITFSGFELGDQIRTGEIYNRIDPNTPLYKGYKHYNKNCPWARENYKGKIENTASFDQTAVLYAVRGGVGNFWDRIVGGYCLADEDGGNRWVSGDSTNHSYLKLKMDPLKMARLIESIVLNEL